MQTIKRRVDAKSQIQKKLENSLENLYPMVGRQWLIKNFYNDTLRVL